MPLEILKYKWNVYIKSHFWCLGFATVGPTVVLLTNALSVVSKLFHSRGEAKISEITSVSMLVIVDHGLAVRIVVDLSLIHIYSRCSIHSLQNIRPSST